LKINIAIWNAIQWSVLQIMFNVLYKIKLFYYYLTFNYKVYRNDYKIFDGPWNKANKIMNNIKGKN